MSRFLYGPLVSLKRTLHNLSLKPGGSSVLGTALAVPPWLWCSSGTKEGILFALPPSLNPLSGISWDFYFALIAWSFFCSLQPFYTAYSLNANLLFLLCIYQFILYQLWVSLSSPSLARVLFPPPRKILFLLAAQ